MADLTLTEGVASPAESFAVTLDRASTAQVTVRYTTTASTALAPEDFSLTEGILTFAPGALVANVSVPITDDDLYEGNEAFAFVLSDATNARIGRSAAVGRIIDDESPPTLAVQAASLAEGSAGGAQLTFDLTLSAVSGVRASVDYATAAHSASEGDDYAATQGVAVFPPGTTTVSVNVPVLNDSLDEFDEQLRLQFSSPSELVLAGPFAVGTIVDDDPLPILSIDDATLSEARGTLSFLVRLSAPSGKPVAVQYSSSDVSAVAGYDYAGAAGTLDFLPGEVEKLIAIPIVGDILYEGQETFLVTLSSVAHATFGQAVAVGTILDDDPPPADPPADVTVADIAVTEGDSGTASASFSVQLSDAESAPVSVDWATIAGTATAGSDFVGASGTLDFPPGTTTRPIDVDVVGDVLDEDDETFRIVLSNAAGNIVLADGTADATIVDDDAPPGLSITDASAIEGNAGNPTLNLTVSLSAASARAVTVDYATSVVSATAGSDFTAVAGTLSFNPGVTTQVVTVPVVADALYEADETFEVSLSNPAFAAIADGLATATIQNDDGAPAISVGDVSIAEGDAGRVMLTFPLSLSSASGLPATAAFATGDLTATAGADYDALSGTAAFAAGQTAATVQVAVIGDVLIENDESLAFNLSDAVNASLADAAAVGTILDDDGAAPTLSITNAVLDEGAAGGTALEFTVSLSAVSSHLVTVDFASVDGTASAGADYVAAAGTLAFAPGESAKQVLLTVLDDGVDEDDETLRVNLANAQNASIGTEFGTGTITDDDAEPSLSISDASVTESDAGGAFVTLAVSLSAPSGRQVTVDFATSDGTGVAGSDYLALAGTLNFDPGETDRVIAVAVTSDLLHEADETFAVALAAPAFATIDDGIGIATILNDDAPPSISIGDVSVGEGDSGSVPLNFSLTLSGVSGQPVAVSFATANGTAIAGQDYSATSGTVNFAVGETAKSVGVQINGDTLYEADEGFTVGLDSPVNAVLAVTQAQGTIANDDSPPLLSVADVTQLEGSSGSSTMSFTVSMSAPSGLDIEIGFATSNGTAVAGSDYTTAGGTLAIPAGAASGVIGVTINGDTTDEVNESFGLTLSNPVNAGLADATAQGNITDDDVAPTISISNAVLDEAGAGGATLSFTVSLSAASGQTISVDYSSAGGTAQSGVDFTAVSGTLNFAPGETGKLVAVTLLDDALDEEDEQLQVTLSNAQNASIAVGVGTGTITDDDAPPSIGIGDVSIGEGNSGSVSLSFSLTLSGVSGRPVAVSFATANGTATAGQDYTAASGTVNFAAGETAQPISIEINGDTLHEADETLTVGLSNAVNAVLAVTQAQGTIVNDDSPPQLSVADVTQLEGSSGSSTMSFTVQLTAASALDVSVGYSTSDGTATAGSDYTAAGGVLAIPAGATSGVIGVTINGDTLDEVNESFSLTLSNPVNAGLSDGAAQGNITDDDAAPTLTISNAVLDEASAGGTPLSFTVSLSAASGRTISVNFATSSGTAQAGQDFTSVSGPLTFTPGQTTKQVTVAVLHDTLDEEDETMTVTLSNAQNASIAIGIGTGTITDNDAQPSLTITDASVTEGDSGVVRLTFTLDLSVASGKEISVSYATQDGTANAGEDYIAQADLLTFNPGFTSIEIAVDVLGDLQDEGDETLLFELSDGVNVSIADASATGTITNDDGAVSWGLDSRPSNLTCIAPERPVLDATIALGTPFPNLPSIQSPIALAQPPGDDSTWFVIEQPGRVRTFANSAVVSASTVAIDITAEVNDDQQEMGLLGMAFHPEYSMPGSLHAGELFLAYTANGPISRVSRFRTTDNWATWTQELVIEADREFFNHNGGNIAFGPDGFLYIGWGDGGGDSDPFDRAQDTTDLLGAMLRLDVDGGTPYAIPPDNPFAGNPTCPADHSSLTPCPEIYAWGFRNPWRWSFDSDTGELWLGDVGENTWEEIDLVELGGNYGWDVREGTDCYEPSSGCNTTGLIDPVAQYDHGFGQAVVGGFVYRGLAMPDLFGRYLFADTYSGIIWMLENDGQGGYTPVQLLDSSAFITSFAQGNDGELYVLDAGTGTIRSIVAGSGGGSPDTIPDLLSETGCFDPLDPTIPADGLIPYSINAPFWSDGADKDRYLAIPDGTTITVGADDDWTFPLRSVIVKNFRLGGELFETRLFMRHPDGVWAGYTYEWNDDGTNATRVIGGKTKLIDGQPWIYPSEGQCDNCHTLAAGFTLGLESAQLNRDFTYLSTGRTANQLVTLDHIALFGGPLPNVPNNQPRLADPANTAESLTDRARAYLYTNCAQCHRPLGPAPSNMDFRYQTALNFTNTCDVVPQHGDLGVLNARLIAPGAAANSIVINRMSRRDIHGMPPLASNFVDLQGAALLAAWIGSLSSCN